MYNFSRDYERLFNILCAGSNAVGFVDYKWNPSDASAPPMRDVVEIYRRSEWDISIWCRGTCYGSVLPGIGSDSKSELECFTVVCKSLNLEWIAPEVKPPQGWVLVPEVATQTMCIAGQDKANEWRKFPLRIVPIFRAMCNAAPDVPSPPQT